MELFAKISEKKGDYRNRARTSYVIYQDATITPARHMHETGSLN